ncbi:MAG: hypothetical protein RR585_05480 [Coprobacillus sp.]
MTMKRFREYRMFWIVLILFMVFAGVGTYCYLVGNKLPMIGCLILAGVSLFLLLIRYKIILMDDVMMIYEWKLIAMLPTMVDYGDIQSIEKKNKHCVLVHHKTLSRVYVFNSDEFISTYQELKTVYDQTKKK